MLSRGNKFRQLSQTQGAAAERVQPGCGFGCRLFGVGARLAQTHQSHIGGLLLSASLPAVLPSVVGFAVEHAVDYLEGQAEFGDVAFKRGQFGSAQIGTGQYTQAHGGANQYPQVSLAAQAA